MPFRTGVLLLPLAALAAGLYYWLFQRPPAMATLGRPAPAFQLQTLDGGQASLASYGGRPVIVNFWATWCEPCKQEMPALQAQASAHPDLVVLGIDNVEAPTKVKPFIAQLGVSFPILLDEDGSVLERYRVTGLPTSFFVDRRGTIRFLERGALSDDILQRDLTVILSS